jgi:hypothetical protein
MVLHQKSASSISRFWTLRNGIIFEGKAIDRGSVSLRPVLRASDGFRLESSLGKQDVSTILNTGSPVIGWQGLIVRQPFAFLVH